MRTEDQIDTGAGPLDLIRLPIPPLVHASTLPQGVKAEDIKANFSNGLLQLTIPIPEESVPKEVKVHVEHAESKPPGGKAD